MPSFIDAAEAALAGTPLAGRDDVEIVEVVPPKILDARGVRALLSPPIAGFLWSAVVFRDTLTTDPLDAMGLLLRLLALALSVRAVRDAVELARRITLLLRRSDYGLVLCDEGLLYRSPRMDVAIARGDVVAACERGQWRDRAGRRFCEVFVVTRPQSGRTHLALPPIFDRTPGALAERLMRWLPPSGDAVLPRYPERDQLASKLWERIAAGERPPGVTVIEHGQGWLKRGPYATLLLGVCVASALLRLSPGQRGALAPVVFIVLAALFGVPISWIVLTRRQMKPRAGLALVLTPAELLLRTRAGLLRVGWGAVAKNELRSRAAWSVLEGAYEARSLVIARKNDHEIEYGEAFLGAPAEVVLALCDAYRRGAIVPPSSDDASSPAPAS